MTPSRIAIVIIIGGIITSSALVAAQQGRDSTGAAVTGTTSVSGTVIADDAAKMPVRRAVVAISGGEPAVTQSTVTDDQGRFAFAGLPAGRYSVSSSKPAWLKTYYGSKRIGRPGPGAPPLELKSGANAAITLRMLHGSAVTGTIVDQTGHPADAIVQLMGFVYINGVRTLAPVDGTNADETDDRGTFRIYAVPPGHYFVQARSATFFGIGAMHQVTKDDVQAAARAIGASPSAGGQSAGLLTDQGATSDYSPVFYPGTTDASAATDVTVGPNEEKSGISFSLSLILTAKVTGKVVTPSGQPAQNVTIRVVAHGPIVSMDSGQGGGGFFAQINSSARIAPDGTFTITSIGPGQYTLVARASDGAVNPAASGRGVGPAEASAAIVGLNGRAGGMIDVHAMNLWAMEDINIDGHDVSNVELRLQPGLHISGHLVFDGAVPPPDDVKNGARLAAQGGAGPGTTINSQAQVDQSGAFDIANIVPGRYKLAPQIPVTTSGTWTAASAMIGGHDALDAPVDIAPNTDLSNVTVRFTDRIAEVSGTLIDASGKPATDYFIVVFSADKSLWGFGGRRFKPPVQAGGDGKFRIASLPAGEYFIAVSTDIEADDLQDPTKLEDLASHGSRLTLAEGEKKVQDFKVGGH